MSSKELTVYRSIHDIPVRNYDRFQETGNPKYLCRGEVVEKVDYMDAWNKLNDELIDHVGIDNAAKDRIRIENELLYYKLELENTGDRKIENIIRKLERKLDEIDEEMESETSTMSQRLNQLSVALKIYLNPDVIKVADFFDFVELAKPKKTTNDNQA